MQTEIKPIIEIKSYRGGLYRRYLKRPTDFILSLVAIIALSPVFIIVGFLVRVKLGSPLLFKQERPGLNERIFIMYKFRTMTDVRGENGELLPDSVRLTKFGRLLRSTSLDELPELFNILKGDMSIIGPRPLLVQYLPLYNKQQKRRHDVRPGLSGLAQVSGRNAIRWEDKFYLDVEYVENVSFIGDLKIIFLTIKKVFAREGISSKNVATMEPFKGNIGRKNLNMKDNLLIIGASGHGKVIADIALKTKKWKNIAFVDDNENIKSSMEIKIIGKVADASKYINDYDMFMAIGNNAIREKIQNKLEKSQAAFPIIIHPNAVIGEQVELGIGTAIMAGAVINCCTKIGKGCIINTGSSVDHDCLIEDYVHVCPGVKIAGTVKVGKSSWIGIGSVVSNNVNICSDCTVGAGAVVVKDINEAGTYVGVPAKRI